MGAWGTAIFSDDTACDVRDEYFDLVGDGLSGPEATKKLVDKWSSSLDDAGEAPIFWLALAATQWKCGRLEPEVLRHALRVIEDGSDLARWDVSSKDYKKRQSALGKLRIQLCSAQRPARRIGKRFRGSNEWRIGEHIAYRLLSARFVVLRVIGHHTDKGGKSPICELLDWVGDDLPNEAQLKSAGIRKANQAQPVTQQPMTQFMLAAAKFKEKPENRLERLGIRGKPNQSPHQFTVLLWKRFDRVLKEDFDIS
jgi:hypothetical protein